MRNKKPRGAQC